MWVGGVRSSSGGSRRRVRGFGPLLSDLTLCLRLKFLHRKDRISLFNWLIFLIKRALHFATKLNSRDIQNYMLLYYFPRRQWPAFTDWETRSHLCLLSDWWEGVWGVWGRINLPPKSSISPFWTKVWTPTPLIKNYWIRSWVGYAFIRQRPMTPLSLFHRRLSPYVPGVTNVNFLLISSREKVLRTKKNALIFCQIRSTYSFR